MGYSTEGADVYQRVQTGYRHERYILEEYERLFGKTGEKKKKPRMARMELERHFLSSVMAELGSVFWDDIKVKYGMVPWRVFRDHRHQVIWRALMEIILPGFEERIDILIAETKVAGKVLILEECEDKAKSIHWFERELEAAGVLKLAGGKKFLRELVEIYPVSLHIDIFAQRLKLL